MHNHVSPELMVSMQFSQNHLSLCVLVLLSVTAARDAEY
jgi:hypothetical protein